MNRSRNRGDWVIALSFFLAMIATIIPLPDWARAFRPEWTALVLIYWCIALPERVGIGFAWVVGILLDALTDTLLGLHALGFSGIAYLALKLHKRTRLFPLWQQAPTVLLLLALHQLLTLWIMGITDQAPQTWLYWMPSLVGMTFWPLIFMTLRNLRRRFGIN